MENTDKAIRRQLQDEMDQVDQKLRRMGSMLEVMAVAYGTGEICDWTTTMEIMLGFREQVDDIRAKLDDAVQMTVRMTIA